MKILFFAKNFYTPQFYGGMEKYLYNLILKMRGHHEVGVFIPIKYNYSIENVKMYHWLFTNIPVLDTCTTVLSILLVAPRIFLRERPQIISAFIPSVATTTLFAVARLFGIKTVINFRGTGNKHLRIVQLLENCTLLFCNAIIMNAKALFKEYSLPFASLNPILRRIPHYYIPNAIDCGFWRPEPSPLEKPYDIVFIANLTNSTRIYKKGLTNLFQALLIIKRTHGATLRAMMIGKYREKAIMKAIGTFKSEFFDWKGAITDRHELKATISQAKMYVLSSIIEGMPNSLMEAMALGIPVVATNVGGVRDLIQPDLTGIIVKPNDPKALAEQIWRLYNNPSQQQQFSRRGREEMQTRFSWTTNILQVERGYDHILTKQ